jgi:dTDP-4-dehydrorhamnose reductase
MIIRISFPYRKEYDQKKDFVHALKGYLEKGKELSMITDSVTTPTFIDDIAYALKYLMQNYSSSIFHINGGNSLSPYEQAIAICAQFNLDRSLVGKTTFNEFYKNKAPRPQYSRMKSEKNNFYKMKSFEEGLRLCG